MTPSADRNGAVVGLVLPLVIALATATVLIVSHVHSVNAVTAVHAVHHVMPPRQQFDVVAAATTTTTTTTTTVPVMSGCATQWAETSRRDLAEAALGLMGITATDEAVTLLLVQFHAEGGGTNNAAWFNPANLSSSSPIHGAVAVRSNRTLVWDNCHRAAEAYADVLGLHYYDKARAALAAGDRSRFIAELAVSPWAGSHYAVEGGSPGSLLRGISDESARANGHLLVSGPAPA